MKKVYLATLDRFGYTLQVVARSEEEAKTQLMAEYLKTYLKWNGGSDPREEPNRWGGTDYTNAEEDIEVTEMTFGKVEWR